MVWLTGFAFDHGVIWHHNVSIQRDCEKCGSWSFSSAFLLHWLGFVSFFSKPRINCLGMLEGGLQLYWKLPEVLVVERSGAVAWDNRKPEIFDVDNILWKISKWLQASEYSMQNAKLRTEHAWLSAPACDLLRFLNRPSQEFAVLDLLPDSRCLISVLLMCWDIL